MELKKQDSTGSSPTTKAAAGMSSSQIAAGQRKSIGSNSSPSKRKVGGLSPSKSPTKRPAATSTTATTLSGILGLMFDKICPNNLATSEGLGADNMTGVLIEFNKPKTSVDGQQQ
jgi:hypothetical protein